MDGRRFMEQKFTEYMNRVVREAAEKIPYANEERERNPSDNFKYFIIRRGDYAGNYCNRKRSRSAF